MKNAREEKNRKETKEKEKKIQRKQARLASSRLRPCYVTRIVGRCDDQQRSLPFWSSRVRPLVLPFFFYFFLINCAQNGPDRLLQPLQRCDRAQRRLQHSLQWPAQNRFFLEAFIYSAFPKKKKLQCILVLGTFHSVLSRFQKFLFSFLCFSAGFNQFHFLFLLMIPPFSIFLFSHFSIFQVHVEFFKDMLNNLIYRLNIVWNALFFLKCTLNIYPNTY